MAAGRTYASGPDELIDGFVERFTTGIAPGTYGIFHGSGTSALLAAYFGLGLSRGCEVLVPTNTFRATVTPLLLLGIRPVPCEADPETGCLDARDAERRITRRTEAIAVTHLWGHPADMDQVMRVARRHGLAVVEDASHAHGGIWGGRPVGSFGDVAVFSLGTKKMISGGMAGILVTRDRAIYERALILGQPKPSVEPQVLTPDLRAYVPSGWGANLRGSPLAAALAADHLRRLPETIRIKNANIASLGAAVRRHLPDLAMPFRGPRFEGGTWYAVRAQWRGGVAPARVRKAPRRSWGTC